MSSNWDELVAQAKALSVARRPSPPPLGYPGIAARPDDEMPSVFVRFGRFGVLGLAGLALVLFLAASTCLYAFVPASRLAPDYRRAFTHRRYATTVVASSPKEAGNVLWTGSMGGGVQPFDPHCLYWEGRITRASTGGALLSDNVTGIDVTGGAIAYACEDDLRRGLTFSAVSASPRQDMFWRRPFLDFTHLGDTGGDGLTSVSRGAQEDVLLLGSSQDGIGRYRLADRHWLPGITKAAGQISDDHVRDLWYSPAGILVANDNGIDVCLQDGENWQLLNTVSGLASKGVSRLYPKEEPNGLNVWFVSVGRGLGAVTILPDASEGARGILISERSVPGLTLDGCRGADCDDNSNHLWVVFKQQQGAGMARYRFADHDWLGSAAALADDVYCVSAREGGSGLAGTDNGVWQGYDAGGDSLRTIARGPQNEKITEIASSPSFVWAHSLWQAPPEQSSTRIRLAMRETDAGDRAWEWTDFAGPRRFAGLQQSDILCVARCADTRNFYFGTMGKGIGVYADDSHEIFPRFSTKAAGAADKLPEDTILDIACPSQERIFAVGGTNSLLAYDGRRWDVALGLSGLDAKAKNVTCAAGSGDTFVVCADPAVGFYEMSTHNWRRMNDLPGVTRVRHAAGEFWGLTKQKTLFAARGEEGAPPAWTEAARDVVAFAGGTTMVAAITARQSEARTLCFSKPNSIALDTVAAPVPLKRQVPNWTTACCDENALYLASDNRELAGYSLNTHAWESLEWPSAVDRSTRLEATRAGLWMLGGNGSLNLWRAGTRNWGDAPVADNVSALSCDGEDVLAVFADAAAAEDDSPGLVKFSGDQESETLIGRALRGDPNASNAAADFKRMLFLGTTQAIARYDGAAHDWRNFPTEGERLLAFAPTDGFLYALLQAPSGGAGVVARYVQAQDEFEFVPDPEDPAEKLKAARLAGDASFAAIQRPAGDVLAIADGSPESASPVYASSGVALGSQKILCAAEAGGELYFGTDAGRVIGYETSQDGLLRWAAQDEAAAPPENNAGAEAPGDAVRKLLMFDGGRTRVVVRDQSIDVESRQAEGEAWQPVRLLATTAQRCDAWDAGNGRLLYASVADQREMDAGCFTTVLLGSPSDQSPRALVGARLLPAQGDLKPPVAAAEFKTPSDLLVFRADAGGLLARYTQGSHAWRQDPATGVKLIFQSMQTLWAYAPESASLQKLSPAAGNYEWEQYGDPAGVIDVTADAAGLLLRNREGTIDLVIQSPDGSFRPRRLVEAISAASKPDFGELVACAEIQDTLVCSFATGATYGYNLKAHSWQKVLDAGVRQFLKVDANQNRLFAVLADDRVARWTPAEQGAFEILSAPGPADKLVLAGGGVFLSTKDGGLHALSPDGRWTALAGPEHRLKGETWPAVSAAAEHGGALILGLAGYGKGSLAVYVPASMSWRECEIPAGVPERFFQCADRLFVVSVAPGARDLYYYDASAGNVVPVGADLRAVAMGGDGLWFVTGDGMLSRLDAATLKPIPVAAQNISLSLPQDASIRELRAAGSDLVAALGDGSIWHHDVGSLGWRQLMSRPEAAPASFQRQLIEIGGCLVSSNPTGDMVLYDPLKDQYVTVSGQVTPPKQAGQPAKWQVQSSGGAFQARLADSNRWMPLVNGRLAMDDVQDLAVDESFIYCLTAAGTMRTVDKRTLADAPVPRADDALRQKLQRPPAFVFDGKAFASSAAKDGLWKTTDPESACRIVMKLTGVAGKGEELVPYAASGQMGLAFQWLSSPVYKDNSLFAVIPGGVARFETGDARLALTRTYRLGDATGAASLAKTDKGVFCEVPPRGYFVFDTVKDTWSVTSGTASADAQAAFAPAVRMMERCAVGPKWGLGADGATAKLAITARDGKRYAVTLDAGGFGFDRVAAMSLAAGSVDLYTRDGMVRYARASSDGVPELIRPDMAVSQEILDTPCRLLDAVADFKPLLLSWDDTRAWGFRSAWEKTDASPVVASIAQNQPLLLDGRYCKWGRDDKVSLIYPGSTAPVKTQFDLQTGRLGIDRIKCIGTQDTACWGITASGICQFGESAITVYLNEDPAFDWSKDAFFSTVSSGGKTKLYAHLISARTGNPVLLRFDGRTWTEVVDENEKKAVTGAAEWLLQGHYWHAHRDQVNAAAQRTVRRHWDWQKPGEFIEVSLDPGHPEYPGAFDFERINGMLASEGRLWLATDRGVVQVDPQSRKMVGLSTPGSSRRALGLIQKKGVLYAQTESGVFSLAGQWVPADPAVFEQTGLLLDTADWQIQRRDNQLAVKYRLAPADKNLAQVAFCAAGVNAFRFDFDSVRSVAANASILALLTRHGLIERVGANHQEVRLASLPSGTRGDGGELFVYGKKEEQKVLYREGSLLAEYDGAAARWKPVDQKDRSKVEKMLGLVLAWNDTWQVRKGASASAQTLVKLPEDADYKPASYVPSAGLFGFDVFNDLAVCDSVNDADVAVFAATESGVVRISRNGSWRRLYCDPQADGMPPGPVRLMAGVARDRLMASGGPDQTPSAGSLYEFSSADDTWRAVSTGAALESFLRLRCTLADNPDGWRILDLIEYERLRRAPPSAAGSPLSLAWKGQPVWLTEAAGKLRFAHDVVFSVAAREPDIWLATSGGCVRYGVDEAEAGLLNLSVPELHAADLLPAYDPWQPPSPPKVGIIRSSPASGALACFLLASTGSRADGPDLRITKAACHVLDDSRSAFAPVEDGSDMHRDALAGLSAIDDGFWYWEKRGPTAFTIAFREGRADLPDKYETTGAGAFRFFDHTYRSDRGLRERTMVRYSDRIFFATAGGIMSYDAETLVPVKLYAAALPGRASGAPSLENVRELYLDRRRDTLFARDAAGAVFACSSPQDAADHWTLYKGADDPFADANVVVDNDLLKWRQLDTGASVSLTNSDVSPGKPYRFFHDGKFSFDYVRALAFQEDRVWLATPGGVVSVNRATRRIEFIYAQSFPYASGMDLPDIAEVVVDHRGDGGLYVRNAALQSFAFADSAWRQAPAKDAEPAFRREYTRLETGFWTWVQPPNGVYVQLHQTDPPDLTIGKASLDAHCALTSRGRLSWDDLREALVVGDELLFTTPAGVCCYDFQFDRQSAQYRCLYGAAEAPDNQTVPMVDIERLLRDDAGDLLAWNATSVFRGKRTGNAWRWEVSGELTPELMASRKTVNVAAAKWVLERAGSGGHVRVTCGSSVGPSYSQTVDVGDNVPDLSRAVFVASGIWCPTQSDVMWLDTSFFVSQSRFRRWVIYPVALCCVFASGYVFFLRRRPAAARPAAKLQRKQK